VDIGRQAGFGLRKYPTLALRTQIDLDVVHSAGQTRMKLQHDHIVSIPRQALVVFIALKTITGGSIYLYTSPARQKRHGSCLRSAGDGIACSSFG